METNGKPRKGFGFVVCLVLTLLVGMQRESAAARLHPIALVHPVIVESTLFLYPTDAPDKAGTGFIIARPDTYNYAHPEQHDFDRFAEDRWRLWLVTAAHVVPNEPQRTMTVETNLADPQGGKRQWTVPVSVWYKHPQHPTDPTITNAYDVAITPVGIPAAEWHTVSPFSWPADRHLSRESMRRYGIVEGDELYTIGFPEKWGSGRRNSPLVRHGIIAQCRPYLYRENDEILIDSPIWGGNSGGPVITRPATFALPGTQRYTKASLLGMVTGVGTVSGLPAGIGVVVPAETINRTIDMFLHQSQG